MLSGREGFDKRSSCRFLVFLRNKDLSQLGEGAYALIPPSVGYSFIQGDLEHLPLISDEMHEELIDILRTFNEVREESVTEYEWKPTDPVGSDRPGDRLNALMSWNELLEPHGWVEESKNHWRRPGKIKGEGISATTDFDNRPMFYVFSTAAAPFLEKKGYSKFHVFALLNHGGDYKIAAREAARMFPQRDIEGNKVQSIEQKQKSTKRRAVMSCFSDIKPKPIQWLWPGKIALGKSCLVSGDPGLGKTLLTIEIAATVSQGRSWPIENSLAPRGDVIFVSAEDDPEDTIRPRLDAAKADCSRIHILKAIEETNDRGEKVQTMFSFKRDIRTLEEMLISLPECKLVIIDPVSAYLDGTDGNSNSDIRGLLAPLSELAGRYKVAILLVSHLNKGSNGGSALYRTMGSLAFTAAVRAAYIVTRDANNPERRLWMPVKNNISNDQSGLAYTVIKDAENNTAAIKWEPDPVIMTADEALTSSHSNEEKTELEWAEDFLRDILQDGPVASRVVFGEAKKIRISDKTLRRALKKLGVIHRKTNFKGGWALYLPGTNEVGQISEDAHPKGEDILGEDGHVGNIA